MEPRIEILSPKKLVGQRIRMTIASDRTFELFRGFMPRRHEIKNGTGTELFCLQVYDKDPGFNNFTIHTPFEKWAAREVEDYEDIPAGMEAHDLPGGLYAVFNYKGTPDAFPETWNYIFHTWLPGSKYLLDDREHFEILGEKYKLNDPESEEEVWIPVRNNE